VSHFSNSFVLAAILAVAVTSITFSSAFAADYEKRVKIGKAEVCVADSRWNKIAELICDRQAFGEGGNNETVAFAAEMPTIAVGRFFGGSWGTGGGFTPMKFGTKNEWRLWEVNDSVPGLRVNLDGGAFLHAQKGAAGTAFVFAGMQAGDSSMATAQNIVAELDSALGNKGNKLWKKFDALVAETTTGHLALQCHNALKAMGWHWDENDKAIPPKGSADPADGGEEEEGKAPAAWWIRYWWAVAIVVVVLFLIIKRIARWRREIPDNVEQDTSE